MTHVAPAREAVALHLAVIGIGVATALCLLGAVLGDAALLEAGGGAVVVGIVLFVVSVFWSTPIVAADEDAAPVAVLRCVACGSDALVANHGGALVCEMCHARHGMKGVA